MFSTGRNNLNEKITITEFCVFLRYLQITERSLDQTLESTLDQSRVGSLATSLPQHKFATIFQKWPATATSLPHFP